MIVAAMNPINPSPALMPLQRLVHERAPNQGALLETLKSVVLRLYACTADVMGAQDRQQLLAALGQALLWSVHAANAMNMALGEDGGRASATATQASTVDQSAERWTSRLLVLGGRMAKAVESADHFEPGDHRRAIGELVSQLVCELEAVPGVPGAAQDALAHWPARPSAEALQCRLGRQFMRDFPDTFEQLAR